MNYNEAKEIINKNSHLIGLKYLGGTISEIILCPSNRSDFLKFSEIYIRTLDSNVALTPYIHKDLAVIVVTNKELIRSKGVFFQTEIINLRDEGLDVNI